MGLSLLRVACVNSVLLVPDANRSSTSNTNLILPPPPTLPMVMMEVKRQNQSLPLLQIFAARLFITNAFAERFNRPACTNPNSFYKVNRFHKQHYFRAVKNLGRHYKQAGRIRILCLTEILQIHDTRKLCGGYCFNKLWCCDLLNCQDEIRCVT